MQVGYRNVERRIRTFTLTEAKRKGMKACYLVIPLARYNKEEMCSCIKITCDLAQGLLEMRWYIEQSRKHQDSIGVLGCARDLK